MAITQVVSVRTTVQKQPGRSVGHNHLAALIPAISMLARATTRTILLQSAYASGRTPDCPVNGRLPGHWRATSSTPLDLM
jgi:hypothetical protein